MNRNRLFMTALLLLSIIAGFMMPSPSTAATDLVFRVDERVPAEDESYVREGIRFAQDYLREVHGETIDATVTINVRATAAPVSLGEIAEANGTYMAFFTKSSGWYRSTPVFRVEVVVHEFIHVYQWNRMANRNDYVPAWIVEGTAEYFSADALVRRDLLTRADADAYRYWAVRDAPLGELVDYEQQSNFRQADPRVYALSYLGLARLLNGQHIERLGEFFAHVGDGARWEDAFEVAFGIGPRAFYQAFERDRRDFIRPVEPPAPYGEIVPIESTSPVRITSLPTSIVVGDQMLVRARSEANARCNLYLWGPYLDLAHETTVDGASNLFWLVTIPSGTPPQTAELSLDCGAGAIVEQVEIRTRPHLDDPPRQGSTGAAGGA